ncbi:MULTISPECIES: MurR/RpiR family transcriptional regulator [Halomonas]|uniref:MurR/RpiR family transcriptional regulator n=3 Tax=Halomonas TaxID=2745 RepID=A0AAU7KIV9_9GAMM|nr:MULTISPECIES: MurR/RpiR family transcriptional regulator [Halomonas]MBR9880087.1 MurR/RpiR family transcriptional regulator [Gammaproteobacteria bacterium]KJZ12591.1 Fe-S cluster assembly protein HesB [Halomonas sp. S2151]MAR73098.1 MurR/RpiR family transcriptional regulator [Halomonas sp.]MBS8267620.1 MurR/RpiR family transcriptional regulator [Halomonas litopenaei]MBY6110590.1 MurR/RpiR family transcriptional regulator [Halomonas sp. DP1Y21-3]|tara:strand:+ start:256 stop:1119 length:864 start_codon:yes stop_codon:yes gene_type:complete
MAELPQDFSALEAQITEQYPDLSRRLQQTARFLLDHPQEVAFSTVARLAEQAGVTPSTLIRFANSLGFKGFSDMQKLFRSRLVDELPNYSERIHAVRSATGETPSGSQLLWEFADANREMLEQLPGRTDPRQLESALDLLEGAEAVHLMGMRRTFPVASYLQYALNHVDKRCFLINALGGMHQEQARAIGPRDALLAVSFSPYASETREVAEQTRDKGVPVVAITDSTLSPLARVADVTLVVQEAEVKSFRGLTATLCLAQSMAIALGVRQDSAADKGSSPEAPASG